MEIVHKVQKHNEDTKVKIKA